MEKPTYLLDIPAEEYHAATKRNEFTTSHRLNLFRKCPALYKKIIDGAIVEGDTAVFELGRATHTFIIEGADRFDSEFLVADGPVNSKTDKPYGKATKAYQDWAAEQTMPVISSEDHALIMAMSDAVHAHSKAAELLSSGIAEATVRTEWNGVAIQARFDWFDPSRNILIDLKTCNDIDRFRFDIRDFGYVEQLSFYAKAIELAGGAADRYIKPYLIAVEKKEPYRVAVVEISPPTIHSANTAHHISENVRDDNEAMLAELVECRATDIWPTRYEHTILI